MSASTPQTASLANVASSAASVTLFAAGEPHARTIFNDSTAVLYVAFSSTAASTTNYTVQLAAGAYFEFPQPVYGGQVTGIWASANGAARTTSW